MIVTLRMSWPYVAMVGFALLMADVETTRAQGLSPCDIDPNSCLYSGTGRMYWYPPGYRRQTSTVTPAASVHQRRTVTAHKKSN